ncbi:family 1 polysaccharide lyase [Melampsora larici-populina 98AG31]|uniref:Family 1 polysaccharide lyase n=1 Tax=Melampsora larici-populina (strain 98AG31 / pathotype 3-4-7) TaxID=747676 RepID=F4RS04_MELLP|nr:family 1 polysaccharide lyase [Melampsora larici-populina 98AG31]EGG04772.1 family 1 polysaccharide lyase [Melampsora larici-populina 98AG31]
MTDIKPREFCGKLVSPPPAKSAGRPVGFAAAVTGGGSAKGAAPPNIQTLKTWLSDATSRVILIDRLFDFTDSEGNTTGPGCSIWPQCSNGAQAQVAIDFRGWCAPDRKLSKGGYNSPGGRQQQVSLGSWCKRCDQRQRNIAITYLNPHAVWGGDAITFNGATDVWIDHCTISLIGRQMISAGGSFPNAGITMSANHFVGKSPWSTDCRGQHYWTIILGGQGDQMTLADNFNNYHSGTRGQAAEVSQGGTMIMEADVFEDSGPTNPNQANAQIGGALFAPFSPQEAQSCSGSLGRACVPNLISRAPSGAPYKFAVNAAALNAARSLPAVKGARVQPAASVLQRKMSQCGVGKIG